MIDQGAARETIVVWFSCGAASAIALRETLRRYGETHTVRAVNSPVDEEDADNRRFLHDVERWLGIKVEIATNPKLDHNSAVKVWDKRAFMSGPHGAPCTLQLKKEPRYAWEAANKADWHVLGFTADERDRFDRFVMSERENVLPVLIDAKLNKGDCFRILAEAGIALPMVYRLGYPNANCIGCVKAASPTYWNHVRKCHPDIFRARSEQSRRIGARLVKVKGERLFLDELPASATGAPMKNLDFECGIFCASERLSQ